MLTPIERVIAHLQEENCRDHATLEHINDNNLAIVALEKMRPMLVNHEKTFWTYKHYCPACSTRFSTEALVYCPCCGQKLDWSNYWEALK
jgi:rRNA maturation endonuclease Nob1